MQVYSEYFTDSHILNSITLPKEKAKFFIYKVMYFTKNYKRIFPRPCKQQNTSDFLTLNCPTQILSPKAYTFSKNGMLFFPAQHATG
jgi:hypothetical protein